MYGFFLTARDQVYLLPSPQPSPRGRGRHCRGKPLCDLLSSYFLTSGLSLLRQILFHILEA